LLLEENGFLPAKFKPHKPTGNYFLMQDEAAFIFETFLNNDNEVSKQ